MLVLVCFFIIGQDSSFRPEPEPGAFHLDTVYFRYRAAIDSVRSDSTAVAVFEPADPQAAKDHGPGLRVSGIKDFFFDTKSGFDQGLSIALSGEIEGVKVEGNLSDQAAPSQTMRIGDIEKMNIQASTQHFSAGLGTLSLPLPFGIQDEIQGGRMQFSTADQVNSVSAAYALNRGSYRRMEFDGEEGKQGPYILDGQVVAGTERVYAAQGFGAPVLLKRDADYQVDYEQAILTFTNSVIITGRSRITVEYMEATSDYSKTFSEFDGRTGNGDFKATALVRRSADDRLRPLNFTLSPEEIESLKVSGDSVRSAHVYYDTSSQGDYDLAGGHFVYTGAGEGHYAVTFFYAGENQGDYAYDPLINGFVYQGAGLGNYTPTRLTPLPLDERFYGISLESYQTLTTTIYGSQVDRNTFSPLDDGDNRAGGAEIGFRRQMRYLALDGSYCQYARNLVMPRSREGVGFSDEWNTQDTLRELAQASLGLQPLPFLGAELGWGMLNRDHYRRSVMVRPWFLYLGASSVDTLRRYLAGLATTWKTWSVNGRYENAAGGHFAQYGAQYALGGQRRVSFGGEYDRDEQGRGITSRLDFSSMPFSASIGHRNYNDTTFLFGSTSFTVLYGGFRLVGTAQQMQSFSQEKDEAYFRVTEGTGTHVYDSTTQSYLPKPGGDYVKKIIMLKDFQRVTARSAGFEVGYGRESYDAVCRIDYNRESAYYGHGEELRASASGDNGEVAATVSQRYAYDARYALAAIRVQERMYALSPSYRKLNARAERAERVEKEEDFTKERRSDYRGEISYELFQRPALRPLAGYGRSFMFSEYFGSMDLVLNAPRCMLTVSYPVKSTGRAEVSGELVYRSYNRADVPYFFAAGDPPGLSRNLNATAGIGVGNNTILSLGYWLRFPPGERFDQSLNFQTRIRF